jgi:anthranilate synthase component 1
MLDVRSTALTNGLDRAALDRYRPSLDEVRALAQRGNLVPIYREILADLETPVSAYLKVAAGSDYAFLLESIEGGERLGRYSFLAADPYLTLRLDNGVAYANQNGYKQTSPYQDPLVALQSYLTPYQAVEVPDLPRFLGGAVGYLGYETVRYFEELPAAANPALSASLPEGLFMFVETVVVFDHLRRKIKVVSHVHADADADLEREYARAAARIEAMIERLRAPYRLQTPVVPPDARPATPRPNMSFDAYVGMIERAKEYIAAGDIFQVVLAQRLEVPTFADSFTIYRALRTINPSPYMFYLHLKDFDLVGSSPELLVQVEHGTVVTHPIAGSRPRGATPEADEALADELLHDEKERAEHIMLVDLGRNDIGRIAKPGSVRVTKLLAIERYSHIMHLVSNVEGQLREGMTALDALRACFPAGTVSGAPKIRAMEIIAELEPDRRSFYAGCVGYVSFTGNMDTCISLRTLAYKDGIAYLQAGGGIVADSVPATEYQESMNKMRALLRAIEEAETMLAGRPAAAERPRGYD